MRRSVVRTHVQVRNAFNMWRACASILMRSPFSAYLSLCSVFSIGSGPRHICYLPVYEISSLTLGNCECDGGTFNEGTIQVVGGGAWILTHPLPILLSDCKSPPLFKWCIKFLCFILTWPRCRCFLLIYKFLSFRTSKPKWLTTSSRWKATCPWLITMIGTWSRWVVIFLRIYFGCNCECRTSCFVHIMIDFVVLWSWSYKRDGDKSFSWWFLNSTLRASC